VRYVCTGVSASAGRIVIAPCGQVPRNFAPIFSYILTLARSLVGAVWQLTTSFGFAQRASAETFDLSLP
jgi:hypothetical protein